MSLFALYCADAQQCGIWRIFSSGHDHLHLETGLESDANEGAGGAGRLGEVLFVCWEMGIRHKKPHRGHSGCAFRWVV